MRNQIYWLARIQDPALFQADYIARYFTQPLLVSPILFGLYSLFSLLVSPVTATQFLPFALVLLATYFLFKLCAHFRDEVYAFWVAYSFNTSVWILKNLSGGLPRAFFYPLLFGFLWALQVRQWGFAVLVVSLATLIYPPVSLLCLCILLIESIRHRKDPYALARFQCLGMALGGILIIAFFRLGLSHQPDSFGPLFNNGLAEQMRDFYFGGRVVLFSIPFSLAEKLQSLAFPGNLIVAIIKRLPHLYILIPILIFGLLKLLYERYLKPRLTSFEIPPLVKITLASSCLLYGLAWAFLFYLYVPERYLEYTLFMVPAFIFGGLITSLIKQYPDAKPIICISFMGLTLFTTHFFWRADLMKIPTRERLLYSFLRKMPERTMIAAPPGLSNNIPAYAMKSVFLSNEAYIPFHQTYFLEMKTRLRDWLAAYYATDRQPVLNLVHKYHINYLILQQKDFRLKHLNDIDRQSYYAFNDSFYSRLKQPQWNDYYLWRIDSSCFIYKTDDFKVIDTQTCWPGSR